MNDSVFFDFDNGSQPEPRAKPSSSPADPTVFTPPSLHPTPDTKEESQTPSKPTFPYDDHKQTTGLPSNSIPGIGPDYSVPFSNTGLDDVNLMDNYDWQNTFELGPAEPMDTSFFGSNNLSPVEGGFVDPTSITQTQEKMRVYPGMHSEAAQALQKQMKEQKQQQQQQHLQHQQFQQQRQQPNRPHPTAKRPSGQLSGDHQEEVIARVLNGFRQDSQTSNLSYKSDPDHGTPLHHVVRTRKEEDEMDEDEKLLASEEGKRLSSKERRQLRNKVSARAFRSRRKEYITQLENENHAKQQQINELTYQNNALSQESLGYRSFIERLLRHAAFMPFVDELSRDLNMLDTGRVNTSAGTSLPPSTSATLAYSQPSRVNPIRAPQNGGQPMPGIPENYHVGTTLVPDVPFDISQLRVSNSYSDPWAVQNTPGHFPRIYSVLELPEGPSAPMDTESMSGKGHSSFFSQDLPIDDVKPDYPVIERVRLEGTEKAVESKDLTEEEAADDDDPEFDLYRSSVSVSSTSTPSSTTNSLERACLFGDAESEKGSSHFELVISDAAENQRLMERFERMCAMVEPVYQRIAAMTAHLNS
jgi:hypothetical protein